MARPELADRSCGAPRRAAAQPLSDPPPTGHRIPPRVRAAPCAASPHLPDGAGRRGTTSVPTTDRPPAPSGGSARAIPAARGHAPWLRLLRVGKWPYAFDGL